MAHLWALEVVVLARLSDAPLAEALHLVELSLPLVARWLLKRWDQRWRKPRPRTVQVLCLHSVAHRFILRQRFEGFEFLTVLGRLQLVDFIV